MKIIFLTDSYFPAASPNAICVSKIADRLAAKGEKPSVITLKNKFGQASQVDFGTCEAVYLPPSLLNRWQCYHNANPRKWLALSLIVLWRMKSLFYAFFWPLLSPVAVRRYYREAIRQIDRYGDDRQVVVVSVYKSLEASLAGCLLKKRRPAIRHILYTLDAVSGSIIPTIFNSKRIARHSIGRWERLLFKYADTICPMRSHAAYYAAPRYDEFRDKMKYMDIPLVSETDRKDGNSTPENGLRFVFTGFMSSQTADPSYMIELLRQEGGNSGISVDVYGNVSEEIAKKLEQAAPLTIRRHGKVPYEQIAGIQRSADVLVNFGNNYPCAIPCKIFEYISAKRPIVSFYKSDDDASNPYLRRYPYALLIDERLPVDRNLPLLRKFLEQMTPPLAAENSWELTSLYWDNTPEPMVREILGAGAK